MITRKTGSETSARLASLAGRAMNNPASLSLDEIRELGGSVLVQREPPTVPIRPQSLGEALKRLTVVPPKNRP